MSVTQIDMGDEGEFLIAGGDYDLYKVWQPGAVFTLALEEDLLLDQWLYHVYL